MPKNETILSVSLSSTAFFESKNQKLTNPVDEDSTSEKKSLLQPVADIKTFGGQMVNFFERKFQPLMF